jgi:signal transduction histidine kinase
MNQDQHNITETRIAALYKVSSQLGNSLNLDEVLNQVMDAIIQLTGAERGFLMLYDEMSSRLDMRVARHFENGSIPEGELKISQTVIQRAFETREGILSNNAQEDDRFSGQASVIGYQLRSIMCAPLRVRDKALGAVYVDNRLSNGVFDQDDLNLLLTFANQAATAIDNAQLFTQTDQQLSKRVDEISRFQQIDRQLNNSLDLSEILTLSLNWALTSTNMESGAIGLIQEDENGEPILQFDVYRGVDASLQDQFIESDQAVFCRILEERSSVVIRNASPTDSLIGLPADLQISVPFMENDVVIGLITLQSQRANNIGIEDLAFVERLADRATVAIRNATLFDKIQKANQAKSDFVSLVTHELRLPITSIKGYADLMKSGMAGPLNEQQDQFLEVMQRNLKRMNALISDLSDINRVESGRMRFELADFDLSQVAADVIDNLREAVDGRKQTIALEIEDALLPVYADAQRVSQILTNLVSNAHKYSPDGAHIQVRAVDGDDGFTAVSIIDNGIGISEEDQAKLFSQFFRSDDAQVRQQQGWGLGLSIVKQMVEAQGGQIEFCSTIGQGSTFRFTLPFATN